MPRSNRIAELRKAQGLTSTQLAAICGVHSHTVDRWEKLKSSVPDKYWNQLSEIFGVSVAHILGLDDGDGDNGGLRSAA